MSHWFEATPPAHDLAGLRPLALSMAVPLTDASRSRLPGAAAVHPADAGALRSQLLLRDLPDSTVRMLARDAQVCHFNGRSTLVPADHPPEALYLLTAGRAHVLRRAANGREVLLEVLQPGDHFGMQALVDGQPAGADLRSRQPGQLLAIDADAFRLVLRQHPALMRTMLLSMVGRLRDANRRIRTLALGDVRCRVLSHLFHLATPHVGGRVLSARFSRTELAGSIGASREMVSRILQALIRDGTLRIRPDGDFLLDSRPAD